MLKINLSRLWYREPYVWLLILIPVTAVLMGIVMIWLAIKSNDGLVVDDYYRQGLEINMVLERDTAAENYGISAEILPDETGKWFKVCLSGNEKFSMPEILHVRFLHRTRSGFDQSVILTRTHDNNYYSDMPVLVRGNWDVLIESDDWRKLVEYSVK